ncbi:MAG: 6-carboxytetrahydropterin synthase [Gammaproteobacteria bacterium]|nr:6-carboxytetrahydropterin synthase [Gammaproteobacteria bacterium]
MTRLATVELHAEEHSFSAGHFTIFSATEREDLHGHNYHVSLSMQVKLNDNGMAFDYRIYKNKLRELCQQLDRRFLLPARSQYLMLEETEGMWIGHFNNEHIPFLKRDVLILPICNITIEELSYWFLDQFIQNKEELEAHGLQQMTVKVFNGPSQSGAASCGNEYTALITI